jgi:hypothetical protein
LSSLDFYGLYGKILTMSELSLAIQKEVLRQLSSKAVIVNGKSDLSVDGIPLLGLDGKRSLKLFMEGVEQDVVEYGPAGSGELYRKKARTPDSLGKALRASVNLSRMLDADEIVGK